MFVLIHKPNSQLAMNPRILSAETNGASIKRMYAMVMNIASMVRTKITAVSRSQSGLVYHSQLSTLNK